MEVEVRNEGEGEDVVVEDVCRRHYNDMRWKPGGVQVQPGLYSEAPASVSPFG